MSQWGNKDFANNTPKFLDTNHPGNTNVYMVSSGRLANASFGSANNHAVAHQGWFKVQQGTGYVKSIAVANANVALTYANNFLTIAGANTTQANASLLVLDNTVSVVLNSGGAGYTITPTVTSSVANANNNLLTFSVTMGGRANRVQAETLVAVSDVVITDANSGLPYFTGV